MSLVGACVLASAAHTAAQASESDALLGLPETISIATGRAQNINTAPAVANLITAEQIRNSGIRDIPEALRLVPGMHVGMNMTYGMNIGVRGFTFMANEGILYLLDGVPMPTVMLDHSMAALGTIPIDMVDRIEVTRGPGSVVFGADAFSAVINVITKKTPDGNLVAASGGSWDTAKGRARVGFSTHGVDGVIGVSAMTTNGYHPYVKIDNQSIFDEQMGTSASLAPGYANTSRREIGLMMNLPPATPRACCVIRACTISVWPQASAEISTLTAPKATTPTRPVSPTTWC